jgi:hypothetical protein
MFNNDQQSIDTFTKIDIPTVQINFIARYTNIFMLVYRAKPQQPTPALPVKERAARYYHDG